VLATVSEPGTDDLMREAPTVVRAR
jgi:hypothetical protein